MGRRRPREPESYDEWRRRLGVPERAEYVKFRCDRCGKQNAGPDGFMPRDWMQVPGEYDPTKVTGRAKRIRGLICDRCAEKVEAAVPPSLKGGEPCLTNRQ